MKCKLVGFIIVFVIVGAVFINSNASAADVGGVDIHGFISQGFIVSDEYNYLTHNSKGGSFEYNEMGINFSKELTDQFRLGMQFFSRDLGDAGNNKVTVDWAFGDYRWKDWLGIRVGRIKLPVNLYNETRDLDMLRTSIVLPQAIYVDLFRDTALAANGAGLYGNIPLSGFGSIDYQVVAGAMNIDNESGYEKFFNNTAFGTVTLNGSSNTETAYAGSLRWNTPLEGLVLATHYLIVDSEIPVLLATPGPSISTTIANTNEVLNFGSTYMSGDLSLSAEYQLTSNENTILGSTTEVTAQSYYVSASYRLTEKLEVGSYYSVLYANEDDKDGNTFANKSNAWEKDLALSMRYDLNDNWVLKLEGHKVDGTANVLSIDNAIQNEDSFYYMAAKVSCSF